MLRIANALSFLTKRPITAKNIRKHLGLRKSHTHQLDMVVTMSNGRAEGNEEGSIKVKRAKELTPNFTVHLVHIVAF